MTEAQLLCLAMTPRVVFTNHSYVSWEKQCDYCPATWRHECMALTLACLPLRCEPIGDDDRRALQEIRNANT